MSEPERSFTPCLDENHPISDTNGLADNISPEPQDEAQPLQNEEEQPEQSSPSKSITCAIPIEGVSDISDEEDEQLRKEPPKKDSKSSNFKKITKNTRERNYRDKITKKPFQHSARSPINRRKSPARAPFRRFDNKKRELPRYSVRHVISDKRHRSTSRSRSRSRSRTPKRRRSGSRSVSPNFRQKYSNTGGRRAARSKSPGYSRYRTPTRSTTNNRKRSVSPSHSRSFSISPPRLRHKSVTPEAEYPLSRRSRSRSKQKVRKKSHDRSVKKKKPKLKETKKHKRSNDRSRSASPEKRKLPSTDWAPKVTVGNAQENIKVILTNSDALTKKTSKTKKREKKRKVEPKRVRRTSTKDPKPKQDKFGKENQTNDVTSKEIFASGDNILVSVSFNNKGKEKSGPANTTVGKTSTRRTARKRPSASSSAESEPQNNKKRRKKVKGRKSEAKPATVTYPSSSLSKRKSDMKPIAIIDLDNSPAKELTQSPKDVIVLSDSDNEKRKDDDDLIFIDPAQEKASLIQEKGASTPMNTPPASPAPTAFKFSMAVKNKSNILPFNLLHDQAEEIEEETELAAKGNNESSINIISNLSVSDMLDDKAVMPDVYDPFEPTKSGSVSPASTPPQHHHLNDVSSSSDMLNSTKLPKKCEFEENGSKDETSQAAAEVVAPPMEDNIISSSCLTSSSIWSKKELDKKLPGLDTPTFSQLPNTLATGSPIIKTTHLMSSLYNLENSLEAKNNNNNDNSSYTLNSTLNDSKSGKEDVIDLKSPYSPSSDDYNDLFEPPSQPTQHSSATGHSKMDLDSSNNDSQNTYEDNVNGAKIMKLTTSTLKSFDRLRPGAYSSGYKSLSFVNKNEMNMFENYLKEKPKSPPMRPVAASFRKSKVSRFSKAAENGSPKVAALPARHSNYHHDSGLREDQMRLLDDVPNSAVDLQVKDKLIKKLNRQDRVVEEVKLVLKPHYNKQHITKDEYKDVLRRAVPKICHNRTGEINIQKIQSMIEAYVKKIRQKRTGKIHTGNMN